MFEMLFFFLSSVMVMNLHNNKFWSSVKSHFQKKRYMSTRVDDLESTTKSKNLFAYQYRLVYSILFLNLYVFLLNPLITLVFIH